ncbi:MAG: cellulase family glycosylhydrolase [Anaerolineae bacterium]
MLYEIDKVRGFNYQPSYGTSGLELWQKFDGSVIATELGQGKRYFPGMNAIRLWLSWDAYQRSPGLFASRFEEALRIASSYGLVVMPVLFNRWHDATLDYGGIYLDHFLPRSSWLQAPNLFANYLQDIVGAHRCDMRILAWDLCNEPFSYLVPQSSLPEVAQAEFTWLESLYRHCKMLGAEAPITVGIHPGHGRSGLEQVEPISDILSIHPYWTKESPHHAKSDYKHLLDEYLDVARHSGKQLLATETVWGSLDDTERVEIIHYTLGELRQRGIGWLAYLLHHSLIADAHRPAFGATSAPGYLAFIEADGSLRPGHEVFNDY